MDIASVIFFSGYGPEWVSFFVAGHLRPFRIALLPSRSLADAVASPRYCHPTSFCSLSLHYSSRLFGPTGLLLPSGVQVSAVLAMLFPSLRRTCPMYLYFRIPIFTDSDGVLVRLYSSSCLRFGLAENSLYRPHAFPVKSI